MEKQWNRCLQQNRRTIGQEWDFLFMEAFMDTVEVESKVGEGTSVKMTKTIGKGSRIWTTQSL